MAKAIYYLRFIRQEWSCGLTKQDKKQLSFLVSQSNNLPNQEVYLVGQMRGMVCCMAKGVLKDNLKISIPTDNFFYQGIAEFTLFDTSMQPIAERLVYVHPEKKLYITAEPKKKSYAIREKASIKIKVTDNEGKPIRANLGISVYDQAYNNPANPTNIVSYSYMSSQIRGKIYDPTYYFDERNNGTNRRYGVIVAYTRVAALCMGDEATYLSRETFSE